MSKSNDGGPAFPMPSGPEPRQDEVTHFNEGMTLRDWFAGQALAGILANHNAKLDEREAAESAYIHADAMLAERERAS